MRENLRTPLENITGNDTINLSSRLTLPHNLRVLKSIEFGRAHAGFLWRESRVGFVLITHKHLRQNSLFLPPVFSE